MSKHILIVDDEPLIGTSLRVHLQFKGYSVDVALGAEEALKLIAERLPDMILLDMRMPGLDGPGLADKLAADPATASIPIVFMSASLEAESRRAAESRGRPFIRKPFEYDEIFRTVGQTLDDQSS